MYGIRLGTDERGNVYYVEIGIRSISAAMKMTIEHEPVAEGAQRLSITGVIRHGTRDVGAGQIVDDLAYITTPSKGWTLAEIAELATLWKRWHLNDMRAGCVHQTEVVMSTGRYGPEVNLSATTAANECPAEYAYGHAWLYEPLPDAVITRMNQFQIRAGRQMR